MPTQSLTRTIMLWLKSLFAGYQQSFAYFLVMKIAAMIGASFQKSLIRNYVVSEKGLHQYYASSKFYGLLQAVFDGLSRHAGLVKEKATGGILHRACSLLSASKYGSFPYVCGGFFALMLIVPHEFWNNIYAVGAAVLLFLACLVCASSGKVEKPVMAFLPLSLVVFFVSVFCAVAIAPSPIAGLRTAMFFIAAILFMLVIWMSTDKEDTLNLTVTFLVAGLFIMCLYAMVQKVIGVEIDPLLTDVANNEGMPGRVFATVGNPNNFAEIIVMLVPFVYALFFSTDSSKKKRVLLIVFAVCLAALAMSYSRSGYIAFAIATVVFLLMYDWRLLLPLLCIGVLFIPFIPETVINRIFTIGSLEDTSNSYRLYLWEGTIKMIKDYCLTGIGIGTEAFTKVYPSYALSFVAKAPHSHMLYMELCIELGLLGFASFFIYMAAILRKGFAAMGKTNKTLSCTIAAAISAFCGISFTACVEYIWFYPRVMFVFFIVAGVLLGAVKLAKRK